MSNLDFIRKDTIPRHFRDITVDSLKIGRIESDLISDCSVISSNLVCERATITQLKKPLMLERGNTSLYHLSSGYINISSDDIDLEVKSNYMFRLNNKVDLSLNINGCLILDNQDYINVKIHTEGSSLPYCYNLTYSTLNHIGNCRVIIEKNNLHIAFDKALNKGDTIHIGSTVLTYFVNQ